MRGYDFHPEVLVDLDEIWEYIAEDNPAGADRVIDEIEATLEALVPLPLRGYNARTSHHGLCASFWSANI